MIYQGGVTRKSSSILTYSINCTINHLIQVMAA